MLLKKVQTTTYTNGQTAVQVLERGISVSNLNRDKEDERIYFSKIATDPRMQNRIQTVELAGDTLVIIYEDGRVRIIQWLEDEQQV
jgi:hypothetical protein